MKWDHAFQIFKSGDIFNIKINNAFYYFFYKVLLKLKSKTFTFSFSFI